MSDSTVTRVEFDSEEASNPERIPEEYRDTDDGSEFVEYESLPRRVVSELRKDKKAMVGAFVVVGFVLLAIFAPYVAPYNPKMTYMTLQPPMTSSTGLEGQQVYHLLGTDSYGHDIFSWIIYGARISLMVALATMAVAFVVGTGIGLLAAYYGGWVDNVLMRLVDFQWAFPELVLAVGIMAFAGGRGLSNVVIAIGIAYIDDFARLIRGEVLSIREEEYVLAARSVGMSDVRIMVKEVLPNAIAPLIVQATIMIPLAIIASAALSFIGLGVRPTTPGWGILLNSGRAFISTAPWISVAPGVAIAITVFGFNLLGDGLRDMFDITEEVSDR